MRGTRAAFGARVQKEREDMVKVALDHCRNQQILTVMDDSSHGQPLSHSRSVKSEEPSTRLIGCLQDFHGVEGLVDKRKVPHSTADSRQWLGCGEE